MPLGMLFSAVSRREDVAQSPLLEHVCYGIALAAVQIDIEEDQVRRSSMDQVDAGIDIAGNCDHLMPQLDQDILKREGDDRLVLDDQDPAMA